MQSRFFKIVIGVLCIYFIISVIISCFTPNVMSQIGKWQAYGLNRVPEIDGYYPEWEWSNALKDALQFRCVVGYVWCRKFGLQGKISEG